MNSRERMKTVLSGEIPDRVPFFPTIYTDHACVISGYRFEDALINPSLGAECMLETALKYQADGVRFHMGPELSWFHDKVVKQEGEDLRQYDKESGQFEGFLIFKEVGYLFGVGWNRRLNVCPM